jgi:dehydrogenase/reductase SDR family member 7B
VSLRAQQSNLFIYIKIPKRWSTQKVPTDCFALLAMTYFRRYEFSFNMYNNKKVWITGASSGIGEAIAYAFAQEGAHLILSGRNVAELERVKKNCTQAAAVDIVQMDIAKHDDVFKITEGVLAKVGHIDVLVNNAGISQRSLAKDTDFSVDVQLINVDLLGTIALTKAVLPSMLARKSGHFIVITSLMGKFGAPLRSGYAAAKHGLHGFFDTLRAEVYDDNIGAIGLPWFC